jgi:hypothetical protein
MAIVKTEMAMAESNLCRLSMVAAQKKAKISHQCLAQQAVISFSD